jgi:hypothetical protein
MTLSRAHFQRIQIPTTVQAVIVYTKKDFITSPIHLLMVLNSTGASDVSWIILVSLMSAT